MGNVSHPLSRRMGSEIPNGIPIEMGFLSKGSAQEFLGKTCNQLRKVYQSLSCKLPQVHLQRLTRKSHRIKLLQ